MWPFKKGRPSKAKIIQNSFRQAMGAKIEMVLDEGYEGKIENREVDFILILLKDFSSDQLSQSFDKLFSIIQKYDADIESVTGSLISVLFNVPIKQINSKELRIKLVVELVSNFPQELTIVHGQTICPYGTIGNETRKEITAFIPNYKDTLKTLSGLEWGQHKEIKFV